MLFLGIMSGTSLDGVDLALCRFAPDSQPKYHILKAETFPYPPEWEARLRASTTLTGKDLIQLDRDVGRYFGELAQAFLVELNAEVCIASHGHTVYHSPSTGVTLQIGHGPSIREASGYPVVYDFRSADVAAGGQGAPLVPIADRDLFGEFDVCLNLGGFANATINVHGNLRAFDICACNTVLNDLANELDLPYDAGGQIAAKGTLLPELLTELNQLPLYGYSQKPSLGREFVEKDIEPILSRYRRQRVEDLLHTYVKHIGWQLHRALDGVGGNGLITGGGAFNTFMVEDIKANSPFIDWQTPNAETVSFKEALAFAYLGFLYHHNLPGNLSTVTGAAGPRILGSYCP